MDAEKIGNENNANAGSIGPMAIDECIAEIHVEGRKVWGTSNPAPPDFYQMPLAITREGRRVPPYAYPDPYLRLKLSSGEVWAKWGMGDGFYFNYMAGGNDFTSGNPDEITGQPLSDGSVPGWWPTKSIMNMPRPTVITLRDGNGNPIPNDQNVAVVLGDRMLHRGTPKTNSSGVVQFCIGKDHTSSVVNYEVLYNAIYRGFLHTTRVPVTRGGSATYQFPPEATVRVTSMGAPARNVPMKAAVTLDGQNWYAGDTVYTNASGIAQFCIPTQFTHCYFFNPETGSETEETFVVGTPIAAEMMDVAVNTPALDSPILLDGGSVYFSWADLSATPNHLTYMIGIAQNGSILLQGQVDNNYVVINGFAANQTYQYQIIAFDTQGRVYAMSATMSFTVPFQLRSAVAINEDGSLVGIGVKSAPSLETKIAKVKKGKEKMMRVKRIQESHDLKPLGMNYTIISTIETTKAE